MKNCWGTGIRRAIFYQGSNYAPVDLFQVTEPRQWGVICAIRTGSGDFNRLPPGQGGLTFGRYFNTIYVEMQDGASLRITEDRPQETGLSQTRISIRPRLYLLSHRKPQPLIKRSTRWFVGWVKQSNASRPI